VVGDGAAGVSGPPVALVSGAARGIGLETVTQLAARGMRVHLGARDPGAGERARAGLGELAERVTVTPLDVTDEDSVSRCVGRVGEVDGRLDVLVNNGGVILDRGVLALDAQFEQVRSTLETNLFGAWRLSVAASALLCASAPSRIINVSSGMGQLDEMGDGSAAYRVSKVALNGLTRMLHTTLGPKRVSVNSVCPGWVMTEMGGDGAYLSVSEGADTIVWLASMPAEELPSGGFYKRRRRIPW
jgi:NAD(P)-dependent dehydrogenase (short-subunit alcohol dehydrogenase family)